MKSYWAALTTQRLMDRRRFLRNAGVLGGAAAALSILGCSDGDSDGETEQSSGLLSRLEDTSSKVVRGGILPSFSGNDAPSFSVYPGVSSFINFQNDRTYSKFVKTSLANRAKGESPLSTVDGDLAESFEYSPDGLTLTMKLRPNVGLDPRPPTNGRAVTVDDALYSWDLFRAQHRSRGQLSNEVNKSAPVMSLTAPDARTLVWKLASPSPSLLANLAYNLNSPFIYPVEADGRYDPARDMRGSGPWMLDRYEPSSIFQFRRNPNYYDKERPYLDGIDMPIVPEYATQLGQLRAGGIYSFGVRTDDVLNTKREVPDLRMIANDFIFDLIGAVWFDFQASMKSVWFDERLRQALSMSIDRDLFIDSLNNIKQFTDAGLPVEKRWNSHLPLAETEFWLDPRDREFGENAKYFKYDPAEATKLVRAAIGKDKVDSDWTVVSGNDFGQAYTQQSEVLFAMLNDGPFNLNRVGVDYNTYFVRFIATAPRLTGGHEFNGAAYGRIANFPEVDSYFTSHLYPGGTFFKFEENFPSADDRWYQLIRQQQTEQDAKKRVEIIKDWQRYAAQKMYIVPHPGQSSTFSLAWPWVGNVGTFSSRGGPIPAEVTLWLDNSKKKS